jgi:parallel beta-helix repeat protein
MKSTLVFIRIVQLIVVMLALVAALVLGFGLVPLARAQTDIYVRPLGDDVICNGTVDVDHSVGVEPNCAVQTIQRGIDLVNSGGTVHVAGGTYVEDLIIAQSLVLAGTGQGSTTILPATNVPTCTVESSSLCNPTYDATSMCIIQAPNVTIHDLTLDGNNPSLNSGVIVNGVDVDARNGIIGDYYVAVPNNLSVYNVTVQNVYLRGIYGTGMVHVTGLDFDDNVVSNVAGDPANSAGMMFYNATGSMVNNTVADTQLGLLCFWGSNCVIQNNTVTDAQRAGITVARNLVATGGISVSGNTITGGQRGIEVYRQDTPLTVSGNTVNDATVGIVIGGQSNNPLIVNNEVDGSGAAGFVNGIRVETDGHGGQADQDTSATLRDNDIYNTNYGVALRSGSGLAVTAALDNNLIDGTSTSGVDIGGPGSFDVTLGDSLATANTFSNTGGFLVRLFNAADDVPAYFNDWGITDLTAIEADIWHQPDDAALGEVIYFGLTAEAAPTNVEPDGIESATITATLTGLYNLENHLIDFATDRGALSSASDTTASDGTATTSITSNSPGNATIIAAAGYKDATTTVRFGDQSVYLPLIQKSFTPAP